MAWNIIFPLLDLISLLQNIFLILRYHINGDFSDDIYIDVNNHDKGFVLATGPSAKRVSVELIGSSPVIAVNRAYKLAYYNDLNVVAHVILDPKFIEEIWPWEMLLKIKERKANTIIILNSRWSKNRKLLNFIQEHNLTIKWAPASLTPDPVSIKFFHSTRRYSTYLAVTGLAMNLLVKAGLKSIVFIGKDGTGLPLELLNSDMTHAYGVNSDNMSKSSIDYCKDLIFMSNSIRYWINIVSFYKANKNVEVLSMTASKVYLMFKTYP